MRVSGVGGTASGGDFRKCGGSFVEMRVESDCAAESGTYFDFRLDVCVPPGLSMYARQRTLCIANWTLRTFQKRAITARENTAIRDTNFAPNLMAFIPRSGARCRRGASGIQVRVNLS